MRAAELLGCDVYDRDGNHVGKVHDLRFESQPSGIRKGEWFRLTGIECGTAPLGHRLGYGRSAMRGPWLFKVIFGFLSRRSLVIEWNDVKRFERPRIDLVKNVSALKRKSEVRV